LVNPFSQKYADFAGGLDLLDHPPGGEGEQEVASSESRMSENRIGRRPFSDGNQDIVKVDSDGPKKKERLVTRTRGATKRRSGISAEELVMFFHLKNDRLAMLSLDRSGTSVPCGSREHRESMTG
jgi:hypothetical protein